MIGGIYEIGSGNFYVAVGFLYVQYQPGGSWFNLDTSAPLGMDIITFGATTTLTNNAPADIYTEIASGVNVMCFMRNVATYWIPSIVEFTTSPTGIER